MEVLKWGTTPLSAQKKNQNRTRSANQVDSGPSSALHQAKTSTFMGWRHGCAWIKMCALWLGSRTPRVSGSGLLFCCGRKPSRDVCNSVLVFVDPHRGDSCEVDLVMLNSMFGGCWTNSLNEVGIELKAPPAFYKQTPLNVDCSLVMLLKSRGWIRWIQLPEGPGKPGRRGGPTMTHCELTLPR